jgi:hypothetical protein
MDYAEFPAKDDGKNMVPRRGTAATAEHLVPTRTFSRNKAPRCFVFEKNGYHCELSSHHVPALTKGGSTLSNAFVEERCQRSCKPK